MCASLLWKQIEPLLVCIYTCYFYVAASVCLIPAGVVIKSMGWVELLIEKINRNGSNGIFL